MPIGGSDAETRISAAALASKSSPRSVKAHGSFERVPSGRPTLLLIECPFATGRDAPNTLRALVASSSPAEEKRRLLLNAAVRVFARKGYHASKVSDIAKEAGVAYGLLYHYFGSKDEVLEAIFRETWGTMLQAVRGIEESDEPALVRVRKVVAIVLRSWEFDPDLIRVLVREVTRSPHLQQEVDEIGAAFDALERIVARGQAEGDFRTDLDARLASRILYGALEQILTGWVLVRPPESNEEIRQAERAVYSVVCEGLSLAGREVARN